MPDRPRLHPDAQAILDRIAASGEPPMETMTAQQARAIADERVLGASFTRREGVATQESEATGPNGPVPVRIYRPQSRQRGNELPILIYYHGGGMVLGSIETVDPHCRWLCLELDCMVVSVGYRLAPEYKFPAGADDAFAAALWVQDNAKAIGGDASRIAIAGESSGGTLAASVCIELRNSSRPMPRLQIAIYPVMDASFDWESWRRLGQGYFLTLPKMQWFMRHYLRSAADEADPRASPLRAARHDGLPPALIITGGFDPLVDTGKAYADKLRSSGIEVDYRCFEQWPHGFFYWGHSSAAQETMRLCIDRIRRAWTA